MSADRFVVCAEVPSWKNDEDDGVMTISWPTRDSALRDQQWTEYYVGLPAWIVEIPL